MMNSKPVASPQRAALRQQSPRTGSPQAILQEAKEFLENAPQLPPRLRPVHLDPYKLPFGGGSGDGDAVDTNPGSLPTLQTTGPPRRLPSMSVEAFAAMKRREDLDSRSSDPGPPVRGTRSKPRHKRETSASGAKSAPASRGTEVSEPITPLWPLNAPSTEPERLRNGCSPLGRPHSMVNLGGITPLRCPPTSKRPPQPPKRSSKEGYGEGAAASPGAACEPVWIRQCSDPVNQCGHDLDTPPARWPVPAISELPLWGNSELTWPVPAAANPSVQEPAADVLVKTSATPGLIGAIPPVATPPPDIGSDVAERSYGWDAGASESGSLPSVRTIKCTRGPRGVTTLAPSTSMLTATGQLGETMSSPDAVKGACYAWVRGEVIGHGTLGNVFKALNQRTGQIFAVKEVRFDGNDKEDLKFKQALENEVSIYKELHHPRIVSYLGHDDIGSKLFIYLEYMPGGSLTQLLSQFGSFDDVLIAQYSRDILEGLEYLHTREPVVLHRDVKGANILVGLDCRAKLSDFGCSKRIADTLSQSLRGSIPWMAPEVIQGTGYGRRSDVWSLGCVAIEMATAKHPWGSFDNPMAAMVKISMSNETPPLPASVSELCRDFIRQCTQRDKTLRPTATCLLQQHAFARES